MHCANTYFMRSRFRVDNPSLGKDGWSPPCEVCGATDNNNPPALICCREGHHFCYQHLVPTKDIPFGAIRCWLERERSDLYVILHNKSDPELFYALNKRFGFRTHRDWVKTRFLEPSDTPLPYPEDLDPVSPSSNAIISAFRPVPWYVCPICTFKALKPEDLLQYLQRTLGHEEAYWHNLPATIRTAIPHRWPIDQPLEQTLQNPMDKPEDAEDYLPRLEDMLP